MGKKENNIPYLATLLLKIITLGDGEFSVIREFNEEFDDIAADSGLRKARTWYWKQLILSMPTILSNSFTWRISMFKNYVKIALRNIRRHKLYSFINILGLAIGIAVCMVINLWVQRELSYDRFHEKADRIFRVERELFRDNYYSRWPISSGGYKQALIDDFPGIQNAVRIWRREFSIKDHRNIYHRQELFVADNSIFEIFDFGLLKGDETKALTEPMTVVLTRENAVKYLGTEDVVGKSLTFEVSGQQIDCTVTGILKDVPQNSHIHFDMLLSISSYPAERFANWRSNYLYTYILASETTTKQELEENLKTFIDQRLEPVYGDLTVHGQSIHEVLKIWLFPITDIHLHPSVNWEIEPGGNISLVYIFSIISVLILIIACINFINLSTARAGKRILEVGLRKTVGARKTQLRMQFILESVLLAVLALFCALILLTMFIPMYNSLFGENFSMDILLNVENIMILTIITLAVGLFSGLYPAYYLTKFKPADVLKGILQSGSRKSGFRRNMVVIQFVISVALIIAMITVYNQLEYIQTKDLGFDKENIVTVPVRNTQVVRNFNAFREELISHPQVVAVSASSEIPGDSHYSNGSLYSRELSIEPANTIFFISDYDYVDTYRMEVLAGRAFSRDFAADTSGTIILNDAAAKRLGWTAEEAVGKKLSGGFSNEVFEVIGVIKNFNYKSLRREVEPMALFLDPEYIRHISIRILPSETPYTINMIRQTWEEFFPGENFEYGFLDNRIDALYESEQKMQNILIVFTCLSVFVACLGLIGLTSYVTEQRTKEIGIRKALGSTTGSIVVLLSREFVKWIIYANIVAWPAAYFLMKRWLQDFVYKADLSPLIFIITGILSLMIAVLTVSFQATRAARAKPVDSLRYE